MSKQEQYCPECLREAAYQRQLWRFSAIAACVRHKQLLVNACPSCNGHLSTADLVARQCAKCRIDLRRAKSPLIGDDPLGLLSQQLAYVWLAGEPLPADPWAASLPPRKGKVLYHFVHRMIVGLRLTEAKLQPFCYATAGEFPWPSNSTMRFGTLSPHQRYALWKTACRTLLVQCQGS